MLTLEQARAHLARLTYKPGYTLTVEADPWEGVKARILVEVEDAYGGGLTTLGIDSFLSPNDLADEAALERWFLWRLTRIECHEAREFFKRDGVIVDDPHARQAA